MLPDLTGFYVEAVTDGTTPTLHLCRTLPTPDGCTQERLNIPVNTLSLHIPPDEWHMHDPDELVIMPDGRVYLLNDVEHCVECGEPHPDEDSALDDSGMCEDCAEEDALNRAHIRQERTY